jgi:hypothetical protein
LEDGVMIPEPSIDPPGTHAATIHHKRQCPSCDEVWWYEDGVPGDVVDCPECGCSTDESDALVPPDPSGEPDYD